LPFDPHGLTITLLIVKKFKISRGAMSDKPTLPPFEDCLKAVSVPGKSGIEALGALSEQLKESCPGLAKILDDAEVKESLRTYEEQDQEAISQQADLMKEATGANICLMGAGVASGLALAVAASFPDPEHPAVVLGIPVAPGILVALGILTIGLGAAATYFASLARGEDRLGRWQASRSRAEIARLNVFAVISSGAAAAGAAVALYGLALVVCHLLDDQRNWLAGRARRHRKSSEVTSRWGSFANALAYIGGVGAVTASEAKLGLWVILAGVVGTAVASFATNREALRRDRANADRYEKAQVALGTLAGSRNKVENLIKDDPNALVIFTSAVTDQLAAEHHQWLEGTDQANALLHRMETQLKQLTEKRDNNKPNNDNERPAGQG
jgi:hypothetical protein